MNQNHQNGNNQGYNFTNPAFASVYKALTALLPRWTFAAIIATYVITAALNSWAMQGVMPLFIAIPIALAIQGGRFLTVFTPFLNPAGRASNLPESIATIATLVALAEYAFSLQHLGKTGPTFWAMFLFGGMVIVFGAILELQFIAEGKRAFNLVKQSSNAGGMQLAQQQSPTPQPSNQDDLKALQEQVKFLQDQLAATRPLPQTPPHLANRGGGSNGNGNYNGNSSPTLQNANTGNGNGATPGPNNP